MFVDDEAIRRLHAQGRSCSAIAAELGLSRATISRHAVQLGLSFDRSKTAAATVAKVADNKARRADIVARLYALADKQMARLERSSHKMAEVSLGKVVRYEVEELPGADIHRLVGAINVATSSAVKLEQVDSNTGDAAARSMIGALAAGLQLAAEQLPPENGDDSSA